jgi:hypothetical protein
MLVHGSINPGHLMTTQPESPDSPSSPSGPPKRDLVTQVRVGAIAFLSVCVVIVWVSALNYDPAKHAAEKKDKPAQPVATRSAPVEQDTLLPPTAGTPVPLEEGTPLPPTVTRPAATNTDTAGQNTEGSLNNPIPAGKPVEVGDALTLSIISAVRPADSIVSDADPLNPPADPGYEYLLLNVKIVCNKPSNEKCFFSPYELTAQGVDENVYGAEIAIAGIDGMLEEGEYVGGSTQTGKLFFIIPSDDPTLVMFYESLLVPGDIIYLELP